MCLIGEEKPSDNDDDNDDKNNKIDFYLYIVIYVVIFFNKSYVILVLQSIGLQFNIWRLPNV